MVSFANLDAQVPQWVTKRPIDDAKYIGIGVAPVSDPDHRNIAVTNAMLDIEAQISVNVESN